MRVCVRACVRGPLAAGVKKRRHVRDKGGNMQAGLTCGSEGAWVGGVMAGGWGGWQWVLEMDGGGGGGGGGGGAGGAGGSGNGWT